MTCDFVSHQSLVARLAPFPLIGGLYGRSVATPTPVLSEARDSYQQAEKNPHRVGNAAAALRDAEQVLNRGEREWKQNRDQEEVEHLAYLTKQRVEIAQHLAGRNLPENELERLSEERQKVIIEARGREVVRSHARKPKREHWNRAWGTDEPARRDCNRE